VAWVHVVGIHLVDILLQEEEEKLAADSLHLPISFFSPFFDIFLGKAISLLYAL
jgi:hypothetical protein